MLESAGITGLRNGRTVLDQFAGQKQSFGCNIVADRISGFLFKRMHQIILAEIKMTGQSVNRQIAVQIFIYIMQNVLYFLV